MEGTDVWPADAGEDTLVRFEESRNFTPRAIRKIFAKFHDKHLKRREKVLEVGSGLGFLRKNWPKRFKGTWVQMEPQPAFSRRAREQFPQGTYTNASVYELPFANHSFDVVCGYGSFDVLYNLEEALRETDRVLRPGGLFFHMLDLGANFNVIQKEFQRRRIPMVVSRMHDQPYIIGMPSSVDWDIRYIPAENLAAFLEEVGMTQEEMDACEEIGGGFALEKFAEKKRKNGQPGLDLVDAFSDYDKIFNRHALDLDADHYFRDKLVKGLSSHFGKDNVTTEKLTARYIGTRTDYQRKEKPEIFAYRRDLGSVGIGNCLEAERLTYRVNQALAEKHPQLARWIEPHCFEEANIECVLARKNP